MYVRKWTLRYWLARPKLWENFNAFVLNMARVFWTGSLGRFLFNQNSGKWNKNFPEKLPKIPETVEFSKCEPFTRTENSVNRQEQSWIVLKTSGSSRGCPLYWKSALENVVPPATGSCRKFRPDVWKLVVKVANEWSKFVVKTFSTIDSISTTDKRTKL